MVVPGAARGMYSCGTLYIVAPNPARDGQGQPRTARNGQGPPGTAMSKAPPLCIVSANYTQGEGL